MKAIEKLIATAEAELGYLEKKSNKNLDDKTANAGSSNYTKYNRDLKEPRIPTRGCVWRSGRFRADS